MSIFTELLFEKQILAIDGGGFRGLGCLTIIDEVVKAASARAGKTLRPYQVFDLICGTSTGGLIAILLGRLGLDCATAIDVYNKLTFRFCSANEPQFLESLLSDKQTLDQQGWEAIASSLFTAPENQYMLPVVEKSVQHRGTHVRILNLDDSSTPNARLQTFVAVTAEAPDYSNRTHYLRSYPLPAGGSSPTPEGHQWSVYEALRATSASPIYMPPAFIKEKYSFRDAGFSGFNNPTELALKEAGKLWPNAKIGLVLSLGTGYGSLLPKSLDEYWSVTDQYASRFVNEIITKLDASRLSSNATRTNALDIVKQLITIVADSKIVHDRVAKKYPTGTYYRMDPSLGLGHADIVDCFRGPEVEHNVRQWLNGAEPTRNTNQLAENIIKRFKNIIEIARKSDPPVPAKGSVNPGYNPQLDKKRPETMMDYLRNYRILFIIDDSGSMSGPRWEETRGALIGIADYALKYNTDDINMRFLNSDKRCTRVQGSSTILSIFNQVDPDGLTPTGAVLKEVLHAQISHLDRAVNTAEYKTIKPLDIIFLTDGVPTDNPRIELAEAVQHMKKSKHHPNCIGVQFVQIGNADGAEEALTDLIYGKNGSMVDTVPYTEFLTSDRLQRILLGALHPNIRALLPIV